MMLIKNDKIISYFNNVIISFLVVFLSIILIKFLLPKNYTFTSKKYTIGFTYYYPNDATGSSNTVGAPSKNHSGKLTTASFNTNDQGWYTYNYNGVDYLVVAAATTYCRDSENHCGISVNKHGIAQNIHYFNYYDTLVLNIGGTEYNAIVLDSCGACMWGERDSDGERFDFFVKDGSATNPGIYNSTSSLVSVNSKIADVSNRGNKVTNFTTTYDGNIKEGYIYTTQKDNALLPYANLEDTKIDKHIKGIIDEIFNNASKYDVTPTGSGSIEIIGGSEDALTWKQTDPIWGKVKLGYEGETISSVGCLATSVSIQMKLSGTKINSDNFNPGTWVNYLNDNKGFQGSSFVWNSSVWSGLAPNWKIINNRVDLPKSKADKISKVREYLNNGYYPVMCVKANCGHWVAVTSVTDDDIIMADPGSKSTSVFSTYKEKNVTRIAVFKKID